MVHSIAAVTGQTILARYHVHPERGFLPERDPLARLPKTFAAWEELVKQLPSLLAAGRVRQAINQLPLLDATRLASDDQHERAMLLLSYLGHAYVFGAVPLSDRLPAQVAVPWHYVATQVQRPPVLTYASHILYNWQRFATTEPITLENLARLEHFAGGMDEDWFGMIHIAIEAKAGPGLHALVLAQDAVQADDADQVTSQLVEVLRAIADIMTVLPRIGEKCEPQIYFDRVRTFLSGWQDNPALPNGLIYEGVEAYHDQPQFFRGGSGAQSAIIPALDNGLGLAFDDNPFGHYMRSLRDYMPPPHHAFVDAMATRPAIRLFVQDHATHRPLVAAYNDCIVSMAQFRHDHLRYAGAYIHAPSQRTGGHAAEVGTGGTPYMGYLKQHVNEVKEHLIEVKG